MANKPTIYGFDDAGCKWETAHKYLLEDICKNVMPLTWTAINQSVFTNRINSICYGNDKFVASALISKMAYSIDGITWNAINQSVFAGVTRSVCYGNGKFVAGDSSGLMAYSQVGV